MLKSTSQPEQGMKFNLPISFIETRLHLRKKNKQRKEKKISVMYCFLSSVFSC